MLHNNLKIVGLEGARFCLKINFINIIWMHELYGDTWIRNQTIFE